MLRRSSSSSTVLPVAAGLVLVCCVAAVMFAASNSSDDVEAVELGALAHIPAEFRARYKVEQELRAQLDKRAATLASHPPKPAPLMASDDDSDLPLHLTRKESMAIARKLVEKNTEKVAALMRAPRRVSVKAVLDGKAGLTEAQKQKAIAKKMLVSGEKKADAGLSRLLTHAIIKKHKQDESNWLVSAAAIKARKAQELKRLQRTKMMWRATQAAEKAKRAALHKAIMATQRKAEKNAAKTLSHLQPGQKLSPAQLKLAMSLRKHILDDSKRVDAVVNGITGSAEKMGLNKPIGQELAAENAKQLKEHERAHFDKAEKAYEKRGKWRYLWGQGN